MRCNHRADDPRTKLLSRCTAAKNRSTGFAAFSRAIRAASISPSKENQCPALSAIRLWFSFLLVFAHWGNRLRADSHARLRHAQTILAWCIVTVSSVHHPWRCRCFPSCGGAWHAAPDRRPHCPGGSSPRPASAFQALHRAKLHCCWYTVAAAVPLERNAVAALQILARLGIWLTEAGVREQ